MIVRASMETWLLLLWMSTHHSVTIPGYESFAACVAAAQHVTEGPVGRSIGARAICIPGPKY